MTGTVRSLQAEKRFGFIKADGRDDYFFHLEDFKGDWLELCNEFFQNKEIKVEFEARKTPKGNRASDVRVV